MTKIIIIGSAAAGINAAKVARKTDSECSITILSKDKDRPYYRPYLTEFVGDKSVEDKSNFYLNPQSWYSDNNIELKLGTDITGIDRTKKTVTDSSGKEFKYDKLILATGAIPFVPIKDALQKDFVFAVRTLEDAKKVEEFSSKIKTATVIGGGLLGLEAAWSLALRKLDVTVIELADRLLPIQLDNEGSTFLSNIIASKGINIETSAMTESVENNGIVKLKGGKEFKTDMVLACIGIRAEITLAKAAELETDRGIIVNEKMQTTDPDVFACGDAAQFGRGVPLWMPALKQGAVAGTNAAGGDISFEKEDYPAALNAFGIRLISIGSTSEELANYSKTDEQSYRKLFFKDGKTVGGILINDSANTMKVLNAVKNSQDEQTARTIF